MKGPSCWIYSDGGASEYQLANPRALEEMDRRRLRVLKAARHLAYANQTVLDRRRFGGWSWGRYGISGELPSGWELTVALREGSDELALAQLAQAMFLEPQADFLDREDEPQGEPSWKELEAIEDSMPTVDIASLFRGLDEGLEMLENWRPSGTPLKLVEPKTKHQKKADKILSGFQNKPLLHYWREPLLRKDPLGEEVWTEWALRPGKKSLAHLEILLTYGHTDYLEEANRFVKEWGEHDLESLITLLPLIQLSEEERLQKLAGPESFRDCVEGARVLEALAHDVREMISFFLRDQQADQALELAALLTPEEASRWLWPADLELVARAGRELCQNDDPHLLWANRSSLVRYAALHQPSLLDILEDNPTYLAALQTDLEAIGSPDWSVDLLAWSWNGPNEFGRQLVATALDRSLEPEDELAAAVAWFRLNSN